MIQNHLKRIASYTDPEKSNGSKILLFLLLFINKLDNHVFEANNVRIQSIKL